MFGSIIDILTSVDNQEIVSIGESVRKFYEGVFCGEYSIYNFFDDWSKTTCFGPKV